VQFSLRRGEQLLADEEGAEHTKEGAVLKASEGKGSVIQNWETGQGRIR